MRHTLLLLVVPLLGCATAADHYTPPPLPPTPAMGMSQPPGLVPSGIDRQEELLQLMASDPIPEVSAKESHQAIQKATRQSIIRPRSSNLKGAVVIYDYRDGWLFQINLKEDVPTDLVFSGGEAVQTVSHPELFQTDIKVLGEEPNQQTHVVITPKGPNLQATSMILTSKGAYYLLLDSDAKSAPMIAVRWRHPESPKKLPALLNPGVFYTGYTIEVTEGTPEWTPPEVWDSGLGGHTLIKLPERASVSEAPIFYVVSNDGQRHLTNWEKRGDWYVITRLITRGELRMGHASEVVMISRGQHYHAVWCPSPTVTCPQGDL